MFAYSFRPRFLIAGMLLSLGSICLGQSSSAPSPSSEKPETAATSLPEVTVIGEALPDPQSKPVSASFLSSNDIDYFRVHEPQDIVRLTPNQSATDSGSRSFGDVYSVRGLTNTVFFGAPATTVYVDDVPFGETFTYAQKLSAVNSVEVLRGPQPLLVGRNTYGGLINVRSRHPGNVFEGDLNYDYGSFNSHAVDGFLMGPLVGDTLGIRIGGGYDSRDGYLKNPLTGKRVDEQEHWGINGGLFWKPAEDWDVSLLASCDEYHDGAPRLTSLDRTTGFYTVTSDVPGRQDRRTDNEALRIAYEGDKFKFLSVTSHRKFDLDPYTVDLDFTSVPSGYSTLSQDQEVWSQEFRFSNNDKSSDWDWTVGAYGAISEINGAGVHGIRYNQPSTFLTVTSFIQPIPTPFGTINVPLTARSVSLSDSDISISQLTLHQIEEKDFAVFAGTAWKGWDPVTINAGVRFDYVQRELTRDKFTTGLATTNTVTTTTIDPVPGFPAFPSPPVDVRTTLTPINMASPHLNLEDEWWHVTPTFGVDWKIIENVLAYAKSTYAFKPGGFSAYSDDLRFVPFKDEKAWSTEVGFKGQWLGGRLTTNLAGFYNSIEDYQVERSVTLTDYAVFNAAHAETYGVEFEARYAICSQLDFMGSIGWTHARLTEYTDPVTGQNLDGVTPPFVPEFDAVAALDFHLECGFFSRLEFLATGNTRFDDFNRNEFQQSDYGLLNAAIGWRAKNWSISTYGTNLTQEEYYTNMNTQVRSGAPGIPREFGVRVGLKF